MKLLSFGQTNRSAPLKDCAKEDCAGEACAQSAGAASPSAPALYWIPAGGFQVGVLNRGSSPHSAMSSTYWDSAERAWIVSHFFLGNRRNRRFAGGHDSQ